MARLVEFPNAEESSRELSETARNGRMEKDAQSSMHHSVSPANDPEEGQRVGDQEAPTNGTVVSAAGQPTFEENPELGPTSVDEVAGMPIEKYDSSTQHQALPEAGVQDNTPLDVVVQDVQPLEHAQTELPDAALAVSSVSATPHEIADSDIQKETIVHVVTKEKDSGSFHNSVGLAASDSNAATESAADEIARVEAVNDIAGHQADAGKEDEIPRQSVNVPNGEDEGARVNEKDQTGAAPLVLEATLSSDAVSNAELPATKNAQLSTAQSEKPAADVVGEAKFLNESEDSKEISVASQHGDVNGQFGVIDKPENTHAPHNGHAAEEAPSSTADAKLSVDVSMGDAAGQPEFETMTEAHPGTQELDAEMGAVVSSAPAEASSPADVHNEKEPSSAVGTETACPENRLEDVTGRSESVGSGDGFLGTQHNDVHMEKAVPDVNPDADIATDLHATPNAPSSTVGICKPPVDEATEEIVRAPELEVTGQVPSGPHTNAGATAPVLTMGAEVPAEVHITDKATPSIAGEEQPLRDEVAKGLAKQDNSEDVTHDSVEKHLNDREVAVLASDALGDADVAANMRTEEEAPLSTSGDQQASGMEPVHGDERQSELKTMTEDTSGTQKGDAEGSGEGDVVVSNLPADVDIPVDVRAAEEVPLSTFGEGTLYADEVAKDVARKSGLEGDEEHPLETPDGNVSDAPADANVATELQISKETPLSIAGEDEPLKDEGAHDVAQQSSMEANPENAFEAKLGDEDVNTGAELAADAHAIDEAPFSKETAYGNAPAEVVGKPESGAMSEGALSTPQADADGLAVVSETPAGADVAINTHVTERAPVPLAGEAKTAGVEIVDGAVKQSKSDNNNVISAETQRGGADVNVVSTLAADENIPHDMHTIKESSPLTSHVINPSGDRDAEDVARQSQSEAVTHDSMGTQLHDADGYDVDPGAPVDIMKAGFGTHSTDKAPASTAGDARQSEIEAATEDPLGTQKGQVDEVGVISTPTGVAEDTHIAEAHPLSTAGEEKTSGDETVVDTVHDGVGRKLDVVVEPSPGTTAEETSRLNAGKEKFHEVEDADGSAALSEVDTMSKDATGPKQSDVDGVPLVADSHSGVDGELHLYNTEVGPSSAGKEQSSGDLAAGQFALEADTENDPETQQDGAVVNVVSLEVPADADVAGQMRTAQNTLLSTVGEVKKSEDDAQYDVTTPSVLEGVQENAITIHHGDAAEIAVVSTHVGAEVADKVITVQDPPVVVDKHLGADGHADVHTVEGPSNAGEGHPSGGELTDDATRQSGLEEVKEDAPETRQEVAQVDVVMSEAPAGADAAGDMHTAEQAPFSTDGKEKSSGDQVTDDAARHVLDAMDKDALGQQGSNADEVVVGSETPTYAEVADNMRTVELAQFSTVGEEKLTRDITVKDAADHRMSQSNIQGVTRSPQGVLQTDPVGDIVASDLSKYTDVDAEMHTAEKTPMSNDSEERSSGVEDANEAVSKSKLETMSKDTLGAQKSDADPVALVADKPSDADGDNHLQTPKEGPSDAGEENPVEDDTAGQSGLDAAIGDAAVTHQGNAEVDVVLSEAPANGDIAGEMHTADERPMPSVGTENSSGDDVANDAEESSVLQAGNEELIGLQQDDAAEVSVVSEPHEGAAVAEEVRTSEDTPVLAAGEERPSGVEVAKDNAIQSELKEITDDPLGTQQDVERILAVSMLPSAEMAGDMHTVEAAPLSTADEEKRAEDEPMIDAVDEAVRHPELDVVTEDPPETQQVNPGGDSAISDEISNSSNAADAVVVNVHTTEKTPPPNAEKENSSGVELTDETANQSEVDATSKDAVGVRQRDAEGLATSPAADKPSGADRDSTLHITEKGTSSAGEERPVGYDAAGQSGLDAAIGDAAETRQGHAEVDVVLSGAPANADVAGEMPIIDETPLPSAGKEKSSGGDVADVNATSTALDSMNEDLVGLQRDAAEVGVVSETHEGSAVADEGLTSEDAPVLAAGGERPSRDEVSRQSDLQVMTKDPPDAQHDDSDGVAVGSERRTGADAAGAMRTADDVPLSSVGKEKISGADIAEVNAKSSVLDSGNEDVPGLQQSDAAEVAVVSQTDGGAAVAEEVRAPVQGEVQPHGVEVSKDNAIQSELEAFTKDPLGTQHGDVDGFLAVSMPTSAEVAGDMHTVEAALLSTADEQKHAGDEAVINAVDEAVRQPELEVVTQNPPGTQQVEAGGDGIVSSVFQEAHDSVSVQITKETPPSNAEKKNSGVELLNEVASQSAVDTTSKNVVGAQNSDADGLTLVAEKPSGAGKEKISGDNVADDAERPSTLEAVKEDAKGMQNGDADEVADKVHTSEDVPLPNVGEASKDNAGSSEIEAVSEHTLERQHDDSEGVDGRSATHIDADVAGEVQTEEEAPLSSAGEERKSDDDAKYNVVTPSVLEMVKDDAQGMQHGDADEVVVSQAANSEDAATVHTSDDGFSKDDARQSELELETEGPVGTQGDTDGVHVVSMPTIANVAGDVHTVEAAPLSTVVTEDPPGTQQVEAGGDDIVSVTPQAVDVGIDMHPAEGSNPPHASEEKVSGNEIVYEAAGLSEVEAVFRDAKGARQGDGDGDALVSELHAYEEVAAGVHATKDEPPSTAGLENPPREELADGITRQSGLEAVAADALGKLQGDGEIEDTASGEIGVVSMPADTLTAQEKPQSNVGEAKPSGHRFTDDANTQSELEVMSRGAQGAQLEDADGDTVVSDRAPEVHTKGERSLSIADAEHSSMDVAANVDARLFESEARIQDAQVIQETIASADAVERDMTANANAASEVQTVGEPSSLHDRQDIEVSEDSTEQEDRPSAMVETSTLENAGMQSTNYPVGEVAANRAHDLIAVDGEEQSAVVTAPMSLAGDTIHFSADDANMPCDEDVRISNASKSIAPHSEKVDSIDTVSHGVQAASAAASVSAAVLGAAVVAHEEISTKNMTETSVGRDSKLSDEVPNTITTTPQGPTEPSLSEGSASRNVSGKCLHDIHQESVCKETREGNDGAAKLAPREALQIDAPEKARMSDLQLQLLVNENVEHGTIDQNTDARRTNMNLVDMEQEATADNSSESAAAKNSVSDALVIGIREESLLAESSVPEDGPHVNLPTQPDETTTAPKSDLQNDSADEENVELGESADIEQDPNTVFEPVEEPGLEPSDGNTDMTTNWNTQVSAIEPEVSFDCAEKDIRTGSRDGSHVDAELPESNHNRNIEGNSIEPSETTCHESGIEIMGDDAAPAPKVTKKDSLQSATDKEGSAKEESTNHGMVVNAPAGTEALPDGQEGSHMTQLENIVSDGKTTLGNLGVNALGGPWAPDKLDARSGAAPERPQSRARRQLFKPDSQESLKPRMEAADACDEPITDVSSFTETSACADAELVHAIVDLHPDVALTSTSSARLTNDKQDETVTEENLLTAISEVGRPSVNADTIPTYAPTVNKDDQNVNHVHKPLDCALGLQVVGTEDDADNAQKLESNQGGVLASEFLRGSASVHAIHGVDAPAMEHATAPLTQAPTRDASRFLPGVLDETVGSLKPTRQSQMAVSTQGTVSPPETHDVAEMSELGALPLRVEEVASSAGAGTELQSQMVGGNDQVLATEPTERSMSSTLAGSANRDEMMPREAVDDNCSPSARFSQAVPIPSSSSHPFQGVPHYPVVSEHTSLIPLDTSDVRDSQWLVPPVAPEMPRTPRGALFDSHSEKKTLSQAQVLRSLDERLRSLELDVQAGKASFLPTPPIRASIDLQASLEDPTNRELGIMSLRPVSDIADPEHGPSETAQETGSAGLPKQVTDNINPKGKLPAEPSSKPPISRRVPQSKVDDRTDPTLTANAQLSENRMRVIRREKAERERKRRENMEKQHEEVRLMIENDKRRHQALREELQQRHEEEVAAKQAKKASRQKSNKPPSKPAKGQTSAASRLKFRTQPKQPKKPLFLRMQEQFHEKVKAAEKERKARLKEVRDAHAPVRLEEIREHAQRHDTMVQQAKQRKEAAHGSKADKVFPKPPLHSPRSALLNTVYPDPLSGPRSDPVQMPQGELPSRSTKHHCQDPRPPSSSNQPKFVRGVDDGPYAEAAGMALDSMSDGGVGVGSRSKQDIPQPSDVERRRKILEAAERRLQQASTSQETAANGQPLSSSTSLEDSSQKPKSGANVILADPQVSAGRPSCITGPSFSDAVSSAELSQAQQHSGMDTPPLSHGDIAASSNRISQSRKCSDTQHTDDHSQQQLYPSDRVLDELLDETAPLDANTALRIANTKMESSSGAQAEILSGPSHVLQKANMSSAVSIVSQTEDALRRSEQVGFVPEFELFREHVERNGSSNKPGPSGSYQYPASHGPNMYLTPLYDPFTYPHDRNDTGHGQLELKHLNDPFNYKASHPHHRMHQQPSAQSSYDRGDPFNQSYHPNQAVSYSLQQNGGHPYNSPQTHSPLPSSQHPQQAANSVVLKDKELLHHSDVLRGSGERIREHLWRGRAVPPVGSEEAVVPQHHPARRSADVPEWDEAAAAARREINARARNRRRKLMERDGLFRGMALQKVMAEEELRKQDMARRSKEKDDMLVRKANYGKLVKKMFKPKVSDKKKIELEIRVHDLDKPHTLPPVPVHEARQRYRVRDLFSDVKVGAKPSETQYHEPIKKPRPRDLLPPMNHKSVHTQEDRVATLLNTPAGEHKQSSSNGIPSSKAKSAPRHLPSLGNNDAVPDGNVRGSREALLKQAREMESRAKAEAADLERMTDFNHSGIDMEERVSSMYVDVIKTKLAALTADDDDAY